MNFKIKMDLNLGKQHACLLFYEIFLLNLSWVRLVSKQGYLSIFCFYPILERLRCRYFIWNSYGPWLGEEGNRRKNQRKSRKSRSSRDGGQVKKYVELTAILFLNCTAYDHPFPKVDCLINGNASLTLGKVFPDDSRPFATLKAATPPCLTLFTFSFIYLRASYFSHLLMSPAWIIVVARMHALP